MVPVSLKERLTSDLAEVLARLETPLLEWALDTSCDGLSVSSRTVHLSVTARWPITDKSRR